MGHRSTASAERFVQCREADIGLPSIVAHELYFGACKSRKVDHNLETLRLLVLDLIVVDFERDDVRASGEIRAALRRSIGPYDFLIAGQPEARDLVIVTHKTSEFPGMTGLRVKDRAG